MAPSSSSPCAACKFRRRKCTKECIYSPYFPPQDPHKFLNVHRIFGARHVAKLLLELHPSQRDDAVESLAYEAEARVRDPVYGCVGAISLLLRQIEHLQKELDETNLGLIWFACNETPPEPVAAQKRAVEFNGRTAGGDGGVFYRTPGVPVSYNVPWSDIYSLHGGSS